MWRTCPKLDPLIENEDDSDEKLRSSFLQPEENDNKKKIVSVSMVAYQWMDQFERK